MRLLSYARLAVLAAVLGAGTAAAQAPDTPATRAALAHLQDRAAGAARPLGPGDLVVSDAARSGRSGLTYVYVRPAVDGVEVADDPAVVVVDGGGAVVYASGEIASVALVESRVEGLGAAAAADRAAAAVGVRVAGFAARPGADRRDVSLTAPGQSAPSSARLVYHRTATGALRLAWEVALYPANPTQWWIVWVDAATGAELRRHSLVFDASDGGGASAWTGTPDAGGLGRTAPATLLPHEAIDGSSYLAYPAPLTSPADADPPPPADGRTPAVDPAHPVASPFGWHDTNGLPGPDYTTTRGNNAHAFPDRDFNGAPDPSGVPDGGPGLAFAPALDLSGEPSGYTSASVTNAFYWVNHAHDVLYGYGFDEGSGNFQTNSYGRGGLAGDAVTVWVQNGSATNAASMSVGSDGAAPILALHEGTRTAPRRDYALDNTVVAHEYTHGLTARLTGGGRNASCLGGGAEQMGEGWSDWYALMLTMKPGEGRADGRGIASYAIGQGASGPGVRPSPYSTDRAVNDYTYGHTATRPLAAPHGIGFVWATVLWEMTWDLIGAHGFSPDVHDADGTAGNQVALSLVTEALRLQPCRPGFVSGRSAILAADGLLYGGAHRDLLWAAFARRGLGAGAFEGSTETNADNVEAFAVPTAPFDVVPPAPVVNLVATPTSPRDVVLTFRSSGDDGMLGNAAQYYGAVWDPALHDPGRVPAGDPGAGVFRAAPAR